MSLVGDIIMGVREQMTDLPQSLPAPAPASVTEQVAGSGPVSFGTGQIVRYQVTQFNAWGESASLPIATYTVVGASVWLILGGACSFNAVKLRVYFSAIPGAALEQYFEAALNSQGTFVITIGGNAIGSSVPPNRGSAWLPDTDGTAVSAASIYRWLNDGLEAASRLAEGIRDITAVPSRVGIPQYQLIGQWGKIDNMFYRGYPVEQGAKKQIFRHSPVTGLSGVSVLNTAAERQIIELWTQPDVTAGLGTLNSPILATDTVLNFTPVSSQFELGFGLAIIGQYPPVLPLSQTGVGSCELVYFRANGNSLTSMTRGLGGTQPQAWPAGTGVQEGNILLSGLRFPIGYSVGQANLVLSLPPAWVDAIRTYLLYRFRDAEQNRQEAKSLLDEFTTKCNAMKGNRIIVGPRQTQIGSGSTVEVASGFGSYFGGIIIP